MTRPLAAMYFTIQNFITVLIASVIKLNAAFDITLVLAAILIFCAFLLASNIAIS